MQIFTCGSPFIHLNFLSSNIALFVFIWYNIYRNEVIAKSEAGYSMAKHAGKLDAGLMAGLGGTLDVFSGQARRAPIVWQKLNLEWLYRCLAEPKRFRKIKRLPQFVFKAWRKRLGIK